MLIIGSDNGRRYAELFLNVMESVNERIRKNNQAYINKYRLQRRHSGHTPSAKFTTLVSQSDEDSQVSGDDDLKFLTIEERKKPQIVTFEFTHEHLDYIHLNSKGKANE